MNIKYNSTLKVSLPEEVSRMGNQATMTSLGNPRVLLLEDEMSALGKTLNRSYANGQAILEKTVSSIRMSMESG